MRLAYSIVTAAVGCVFSLSAVHAAPQSVEGSMVVVTKDDVPLRSGAATLFYTVARLKAGTVLMTDKEESGFCRVTYPAGSTAYVVAEEVTLEAGGKSAKLNKPSRLKAANLTAGPRGSWYNLLEKELDAGTELKVSEPVKGDDGKVTMYAITPPTVARAFLNREWIRPATPEEIAAAAPAKAPEATLVPDPKEAKPATGPAPVNPPTPPGPEGTKPDGEPSTTDKPVATTPRPAAPAPAPVQTKVEKLAAVFAAVKAQPEADAEAAQAMVEMEKHMATLDNSPAGERERRYVKRFVDYLKLRADIQQARRATEESTRRFDGAAQAIRDEIKKLEAQAVYTAIGRLTTSAVYDGERLPKLYRIISPEPGTPRTIGYLLPDAAMDLDSKIGRVVGIVGDSKMDDSLRATVLKATRVDVVSLQPVHSSTPAEAPAATPPDINK
ncbi:MAG: SH3 domain-containing protein [Phycisphaerales bacterium]